MMKFIMTACACSALFAQSANAAVLWEMRTFYMQGEAVEDTNLFMGKDFEQALEARKIMNADGTGCIGEQTGGETECQYISWCSKPGWFGKAVGGNGAFAVVCGYDTKEEAINAAEASCLEVNPNVPACIGGIDRVGFDNGRGIDGITPSTAFQCGKLDSACGTTRY